MPIRWPQTSEAKSLIAEGALLLAALPFLLFPNFSTLGTLVAFCILILVELVPLLFRWRLLPVSQPFDLLLLIWLFFIGLSIVVTADTDLTLSKASGVLLGIALWRYLSRAVKRPFHWYLALAFWGLLGAGFIGLGVLSAVWITKNNFHRLSIVAQRRMAEQGMAGLVGAGSSGRSAAKRGASLGRRQIPERMYRTRTSAKGGAASPRGAEARRPLNCPPI